MAQEFLGKGWRFPTNVSLRGGIELSEYERDIKEAIWIILGTSKGERIMRPEFGCGIHDLTFSVFNTSSMGMIKESVKEALILWEPRIDIINIDVSQGGDDDERVLIDLDYKVRATNNEFNLVYPYYLKE
jgi:phage baseplate assembly protein W